jgi:hypothetical protein
MNKRKARPKNSKQAKLKKRRVVTVVTNRADMRVKSVFRLRQMRDWVKWITSLPGWSYRKLSTKTRRKFGWWQHIGSGHFQVCVYRQDYDRLKDIYDLLQINADLNRREVGLLLDIIEYRGKMDAALSKLIVIERQRVAPTI